jgi:hypothetical protein
MALTGMWPAYGGGFRPRRKDASRLPAFCRPCEAWDRIGDPYPTVETVGYYPSPLRGGSSRRKETGSPVQARRAIDNSPAIHRWVTGAKDKTSPARDERGAVGIRRLCAATRPSCHFSVVRPAVGLANKGLDAAGGMWDNDATWAWANVAGWMVYGYKESPGYHP